jgi:hypothetical protein
MWDDDRIKALNSEEVVNNLPSQPILVATQNISSTLTQLFVSVLRANVPGFSDFVSSSTNPSFPVQSTNRSLVTTAADGVMPLLNANSYSFAFWQLYDISLVSKQSMCIPPYLTLADTAPHQLYVIPCRRARPKPRR